MIEKRPFGRTGHQSTATIFGAAALARVTQDEADRALEVLLAHGVNHIDTAARYGDSELRIGPWMARHRKDFFLATKTGSRGARAAREDLHRSLERLRVDRGPHPDPFARPSRRLGPGDGPTAPSRRW
jgi:aryl-alcohol dehydrogenase-like predicted oxidoreductase